MRPQLQWKESQAMPSRLKITGDGSTHGTRIQDTDGKDIPGLSVQAMELKIDSLKSKSEPTVKLVLCPWSTDLDLIVTLDQVQKDILRGIIDDLFMIQDSLHGKSLDKIQDEIFILQERAKGYMDDFGYADMKENESSLELDIPEAKDTKVIFNGNESTELKPSPVTNFFTASCIIFGWYKGTLSINLCCLSVTQQLES